MKLLKFVKTEQVVDSSTSHSTPSYRDIPREAEDNQPGVKQPINLESNNGSPVSFQGQQLQWLD